MGLARIENPEIEFKLQKAFDKALMMSSKPINGDFNKPQLQKPGASIRNRLQQTK